MVPFMDCVRLEIEESLGGYRCQVAAEDPKTKEKTTARVAIVGGGLAGLTAASTLLERGFEVHIFESEDYIGGKCGAWKHKLKNGQEVHVSHGLHGIFPQYYNCRRFFEKVGINKFYKNIGEYTIFNKQGDTVGFKNDLDTAPILSLISMWRHGLFSIVNVLKNLQCIPYLMESLMYAPGRTERLYDNLSYLSFCQDSSLPADLEFMFTTFARSFFATADKISMTSLLKSFHFYFMSNDGGLLYDILAEDWHQAFCEPMRKHISSLGGHIHMTTPVEELGVQARDNKVTVNGKVYDHCILACDVKGIQTIVKASPNLPPSLTKELNTVFPGQRYAVVKVWLDQKGCHGLPDFFFFEKKRLLDSVAQCHRYEQCSQNCQGDVYELHCYAVPDDVPNEKIIELSMADLREYCPELKEARVLDHHLMIKQNFTAFHVGTNGKRPVTKTNVPTICLAGDWVRLPAPCALMEAAVTSGILAANDILSKHGHLGENWYHVPLLGIFGSEDSSQIVTWTIGPLRWGARLVWIMGMALLRFFGLRN